MTPRSVFILSISTKVTDLVQTVGVKHIHQMFVPYNIRILSFFDNKNVDDLEGIPQRRSTSIEEGLVETLKSPSRPRQDTRHWFFEKWHAQPRYQ